jgi:hypothetical protein
MTGQVLEVSEDLSKSEESFVQKIDTTYYDILQEEKAQSSRMKEVLDKIWHEKTVDQKLTILEATEPHQDPLLEETKEEEGKD